jgi:DNA-binding HxlR family transcriptional regulator
MTEIGYDEIETATSFVEYLYEKYGFSKSCIWYNLKKLKKLNIVDFSEKAEIEPAHKPLSLTRKGVSLLRNISTMSKFRKDYKKESVSHYAGNYPAQGFIRQQPAAQERMILAKNS